MEEVRGVGAVRGMEDAHVGSQEEGTGHGDVEHLVRINGEGISQVYTPEFILPMVRRKDDGSTPAGIDVHPDFFLATHGGDGLKGVIGPQDRGARGRVDVQRCLAAGPGLPDQGGETVRAHTTDVVDGDQDHGSFAHAGDDGGFFDGIMTMFTGKHDKPVVCVAPRFGVRVESTAGDDQTGQVGPAAAWTGHAAGKGAGETEARGETAGGETLEDGEGGGDGVDVDIGVEGGQEHLGDQADRGGAAVELVEKALVPGVDAVGEDLGDGLEQAVATSPLLSREDVPEVFLEPCGREEVTLDQGVGDGPGTGTGGATGGPESGSIIGAPDEGDDQILDGIDELMGEVGYKISVRVFIA